MGGRAAPIRHTRKPVGVPVTLTPKGDWHFLFCKTTPTPYNQLSLASHHFTSPIIISPLSLEKNMPAPTHPHQDWQQTIFLRYGQTILDRCRDYYAQLAALPRATRRKLKTATGMGLTALALALALAGSPTPAHAATITVGTDCKLWQAIQSANRDSSAAGSSCTAGSGADTIVLAGNTYIYTSTNGTNAALRDITTLITIEANGATIARDSGADSDFRILTVANTGNLTLNNATITGGVAGAFPHNLGGGIVNGGTVTLNNSTVSGNSAQFGGGVDNSGMLTLNNSTVSGNSADERGGGIDNSGGLMLNNSTVSDNWAIYGGGIDNNLGTATLSNSTVSGNSARSGGGIDNSGGLTLNNSTVSDNSAIDDGGGIDNSGTATLSLSNSTVSRNWARFGGGILNSGTATLSLSNSTVSDNSARSGGGILNVGGLTLNNSTVSFNLATYGGGVYNSGTTTLVRTIISGNNTDFYSGAEVSNYYGTVNSDGHNIIGYGGSARSVGFTPGGTDVVPGGTLTTVLNFTLADNGGPTLTHALVSGSPAINIIPLDGVVCIFDTSTDQRGAVRGSGVNRGEGACDAGAFEFNSIEIPTAVTDLQASQTSEPAPTGMVASVLAAMMLALGTTWAAVRRP